MSIYGEFTDKPVLENTMTVWSDGGCRKAEKFTGWGCFTEVNVKDSDTDICRITASGSITAPSTNQVAELVAATKAMEIALDHDITDLTIKTDSQYVIEGLTKHYPKWQKNGYKNSQGNPIANRGYWDTIADTRKKLITKGAKVSLQWVKGHSGVLGNEWADRLATIGVGMSSRSPKETSDIKYYKVSRSAPPAPVVKGKYKFNYNRMHINDFVYFRVGEIPTKNAQGFFTYYTGKMEGLDELGVLAAENKLGVLKLKEPLPLLNEVCTAHAQMDVDHLGLIGQCITRHLYQVKVTQPLEESGVGILTRIGNCYSHVKEKPTEKGPYRGKGNWREKDDLYFDDKCITYIANPPRNSFKLLDQLGELETILTMFIKHGFKDMDHIVTYDVTDDVYDITETVNGKGVTKRVIKANPKLAPPATTYKHTATLKGKKYRTTMRLGLDFLQRNDFSGLIKTKGIEPVVTMVYIIRGGVANWYTIIERDGDYGIYSAQCSNLIIL